MHKLFEKKILDIEKESYICIPQTEGAIAQSVEQRTENPCVPGSNPGGTTSKSFREIWSFFGLKLFWRFQCCI